MGRVLDVPLGEVDRIARKVPDGPHVNLEGCIEADGELRAYEEDTRYQDLFQIARRVEGSNRNAGVHAAGVVISDVPLSEVVPLYKVDDVVVTQYDMESLEKTGLLKMDFLGLKTLTILEKARELIKKRTGRPPISNRWNTTTRRPTSSSRTATRSACSNSNRRGCGGSFAKIRPNRFEDIIAVLALYRPGPLGMGMH